MKRLLHILFCLILICTTLTTHSACSDIECISSNTSYVYYSFYLTDGSEATWTTAITVTAAGTDSVLINQESNASYMSLPLSYTNQVDTFVINYTSEEGGMIDSIFITHQNIPQFISMDCGLGMFYYIDDARSTDNAIDHLEIINREVTYDTKENIRIYYRSNS